MSVSSHRISVPEREKRICPALQVRQTPRRTADPILQSTTHTDLNTDEYHEANVRSLGCQYTHSQVASIFPRSQTGSELTLCNHPERQVASECHANTYMIIACSGTWDNFYMNIGIGRPCPVPDLDSKLSPQGAKPLQGPGSKCIGRFANACQS